MVNFCNGSGSLIIVLTLDGRNNVLRFSAISDVFGNQIGELIEAIEIVLKPLSSS